MASHSLPRHRGRLLLATGIALVGGAVLVPAVNAATPEATAVTTTATTPSTKRLHDDFNGDGYPDLAIGAPGTALAGTAKAGAVSVLYGSSSGLSTSRKQVLTWSGRDTSVPQTGYGSALQSADLDRDGYADLVSTVDRTPAQNGPNYDGLFLVVNWGGPKGLSAVPTPLSGIPETSYPGLTYGLGDVDGDRNPDVVLLADVNGDPDSPGDGTVLRGPFSRAGDAASAGRFTADPEGMSFFDGIAVGDVTGDGIADLAVSSMFVDEPDSRAVELLVGGPNGFTRKGALKDSQGRVIGGEDIEIGDLDKDGYGDIVVGHIDDGYDSDVELPTKGGALGIVYGGPNGFSTTRRPVWINQDTPGVPGVGEYHDGMGSGLSIGDTNGDGYLDVATGLPGEDFDGLTDAGTVLVLRGSAGGLTTTGAKSLSQNTGGVPGSAEKLDRFGADTALVDAGGDKRDGLVVGDWAENAGNGAAWVFSATSSGITASGSFTFGATTMGLPATGANFGASLAD
ncbi:FG-GAP-like repeat-containing protein [Streptomyces sp. NPDC049627]|uniref:FG-GAP-like repeat-containing protein n=1 Tax=Streptomyces sp. NPDC049627 TaxID=3365595 RepID=UPI0037B2FA44